MSHLLHAVLLASEAPRPPVNIIVGTYSGEIITLGYSEIYGTLQLRHSTIDSAPAPSWQCLSRDRRFLYTVEEQSADGTSKSGAVASYSVLPDGKLEKRSVARGLYGPVSLDVSKDGTLLVAACYDGSGVSTYQVNPDNGSISHLRDITYHLSHPGPIKDRQDASHPHQALFDPTGRFVFVPDLGADLIRIFHVHGLELKPHLEVSTKPGTGPRHGTFVSLAGKTTYYLVGELSNTISAFSVSYPQAQSGEETITLEECQTLSTLPADHPPLTSTAAAIIIKDSFLYVSNRGDAVFPNSDSIAMYHIRNNDNMLELQGFMESGVRMPRCITIDPSGKWLVTCGQKSEEVKLFRRSQTNGIIGKKPEATFSGGREFVCATWL